MEVFLVPVEETRYELYCELAASDQSQQTGLAGRMRRRFREVLAAEQEERRDRRAARHPSASDRSVGWMARVRSGIVRGMAEWVAEQRLLWRLRQQDAAILVYPNDLDSDRALSMARGTLQREIDHHRFWMVLDGLGVLVFGPAPRPMDRCQVTIAPDGQILVNKLRLMGEPEWVDEAAFILA